jgi:hypothetical protein
MPPNTTINGSASTTSKTINPAMPSQISAFFASLRTIGSRMSVGPARR